MRIQNGTGCSLEVIGRLKSVPEVFTTSKGTLFARITLAVDRWQSGNSYTEWRNICVRGKAVEFLRNYAHAGMRLKISATVRTEIQAVVDAEGESRKYYIPTFHTNMVEAMDGIRSPETAAASNEPHASPVAPQGSPAAKPQLKTQQAPLPAEAPFAELTGPNLPF